MKRLLLLTAAAALLAAPVFAQTQTAPKPKATTGQAQPKQGPAVKKGPNDVWCGGVYLGSDPDPAVRLQMLKDYKHECN